MIPSFLALASGQLEELCQSALLRYLLELDQQGQLPESWCLLLLSPEGSSSTDLRAAVETRLPQSRPESLSRLHCFASSDFNPQECQKLQQTLAMLNQTYALQDNLLFCALQPNPSDLLRSLDALGLARPSQSQGFRRLWQEVPLQLVSEQEHPTQCEMQKFFHESQIFRPLYGISQPMLQELLSLRFANSLFEPLWNRHQIQQLEISWGERHSHSHSHALSLWGPRALLGLLQLLAVLTMEAPALMEEQALRNEMLKLYHSLHPLEHRELKERTLRGRRQDLTKAESLRETFLALRLNIDNNRWSGIPIYLRAATASPSDRLDIVVQFQTVTTRLFAGEHLGQFQNRLLIRLLPKREIVLYLGLSSQTTLPLKLQHLTIQQAEDWPTHHRQALLDCLRDQRALFLRSDASEILLKWMHPLLESWNSEAQRPYPYGPERWGPAEAEALFEDLHGQWWEESDQP